MTEKEAWLNNQSYDLRPFHSEKEAKEAEYAREQMMKDLEEQIERDHETYENIKDPKSLISDPLKDVTRKQRRSLLAASLVTFIIYSATDFINWRLAIKDASQELKDSINFEPVESIDWNVNWNRLENVNTLDFKLSKLEKSAKPVSYIRAGVEFLFPFLFAIFAIIYVFLQNA